MPRGDYLKIVFPYSLLRASKFRVEVFWFWGGLLLGPDLEGMRVSAKEPIFGYHNMGTG